MVMPALERRRWTAAEVRALPEEPGKLYEVIDGELFVSPGPSLPHQFVIFELMTRLHAYVTREHIGAIANGPAEIEPDPYTLVQPDIFVLPLVDGRKPLVWDDSQRLLLAVEVLSPSSMRKDRVKKRALYQRMGVEYWIVDWEARLVERWLPVDTRPEILTDAVVWQPDSAREPLSIDLGSLFVDAFGERGTDQRA